MLWQVRLCIHRFQGLGCMHLWVGIILLTTMVFWHQPWGVWLQKIKDSIQAGTHGRLALTGALWFFLWVTHCYSIFLSLLQTAMSFGWDAWSGHGTLATAGFLTTGKWWLLHHLSSWAKQRLQCPWWTCRGELFKPLRSGDTNLPTYAFIKFQAAKSMSTMTFYFHVCIQEFLSTESLGYLGINPVTINLKIRK